MNFLVDIAPKHIHFPSTPEEKQAVSEDFEDVMQIFLFYFKSFVALSFFY